MSQPLHSNPIAARRMAKALLLCGCTWLATLVAGCAATAPATSTTPASAAITPLRVMSFNVRLPVESDGVNR